MKRRARSRKETRKIALERIFRLAELAFAEAERGRIERSKRYVELARRIGMRAEVPLPSPFRRSICRECHAYLLPGRTSRVRIRSSAIVVTCQECGRIYRYPFGRSRTPPVSPRQTPKADGSSRERRRGS